MHKISKKTIKATILDIIVAFFIIAIILFVVNFVFGPKIEAAILLANKITIDIDNKAKIEKIEINDKTIKHYPEYGSKYATIEIPKINVDLPVYFGDTLEILKKGVGHSSGSYFPGEGGSIVYMGHNAKNIFRRFSELQIGNEITIKAEYGTYKYKIYDMQLVHETETDKLPIQREKEILMIYTCYPFNNIGYATHRYVVYAELVN